MPDHHMHITVGIILRPHGVKGYVRVQPTTDHPERFHQLKVVQVVGPEGVPERLTIDRVSYQGKNLLIKFAEVGSRTDAEKLRGREIVITREECLPLGQDEYYIFDLVGCRVLTTGGEEIGIVEDVWSYPANDVYVVRKGDLEVLIPAVAHVVKNVNLDRKEIIIELIEGLLPEK